MMKKLLTQRIKKTEEIPKYLPIKQAKLYLEKKEFLVNESKLYKMTSESKILFYQSGNRNYFFPDEQEEWLQEQLGMKSETSRYFTGRDTINYITKSAQLKKRKVMNTSKELKQFIKFWIHQKCLIFKGQSFKYEPFWNEYKEYCSKHNYPIPDELLFWAILDDCGLQIDVDEKREMIVILSR